MENNFREIGLNCLVGIKSEHDRKVIEKKIYLSVLKLKPDDILSKYVELITMTVIKIKSGNNLIDIYNSFDKNNYDWNCREFDDCKIELEEYDQFVEKPFDIDEGVVQCEKCGSKRTFSYAKQTRSGDESTTVFCTCAKCGAKWKM